MGVGWRWCGLRAGLRLVVVAALALAGEPSAGTAQTAVDSRFGIDEGVSDLATMEEVGAGWDRVLVPWYRIQPRGPEDFPGFGWVLPESAMNAEIERGVRMAGVLHYTPGWAATDPADATRGVPRNLFLAFDDPDNYAGRFVSEAVRFYSGRIDDWIVWNEPDFQPGDSSSDAAVNWRGSDEEFAQLLKVAYLAAKAANPHVVVSFPATSYWIDVEKGRTLFYARILDILARDPDAAAHDYYHDAVALNLYERPDDVYRVHAIFKDIQHARGLDKPVWLTETNAMPVDDQSAACWERHTGEPYPTTMQQQAAFAVQTFALAAAAGYERIAFWRMIDGRACQQTGLWGAVRDDGSRRPVADALRTAVRSFAGFTHAQFVPLAGDPDAWAAWAAEPTSTPPDWQVYQVALDRPGNQRVTVLWNAGATPRVVSIPRSGRTAQAVAMDGLARGLEADPDGWTVELPGATASFPGDPPGHYYIGGEPVLIIEDGVDPTSVVVPPTRV